MWQCMRAIDRISFVDWHFSSGNRGCSTIDSASKWQKERGTKSENRGTNKWNKKKKKNELNEVLHQLHLPLVERLSATSVMEGAKISN